MAFSGGEVSVLGPLSVSKPPWASFAGKSSGLTYATIGKFFLYTDDEWAETVLFHVEASFRSTSGGTVGVRLYDVTAAAVVTDSEITTTSSTMARYRSGSLVLTDGNEYRLQVGVESGAAGAILGASVLGLTPEANSV